MKKERYPIIFFLLIVALFISAASFIIGRTSMEREAAMEKTPGLVVITDQVLTMGELDRICEIIESGGRGIVEIQSLLGDEIQYRIRFKNKKEVKRP